MSNHLWRSTTANSCSSMRAPLNLLKPAISQAVTVGRKTSVHCPENVWNLPWSKKPLSIAKMRKIFILELQSNLSRSVTQSRRRPSTRRIPPLQLACQLMFGVLKTKEKTPKLSGNFQEVPPLCLRISTFWHLSNREVVYFECGQS